MNEIYTSDPLMQLVIAQWEYLQHIDEVKGYRLMYIYQKNLIISAGIEELNFLYRMPELIETNLKILNDFLEEDLFAHSNYQESISQAVDNLAYYQRKYQSPYNTQLNDLIVFKNSICSEKKNTNEEFLLRECTIRQLKFRDKINVMGGNKYPAYETNDLVVYLTEYIWLSDFRYCLLQDPESHTDSKIFNRIRQSSINKIEEDYQLKDHLKLLHRHYEEDK